jgi:hypothetical protein
MLDLLNNQAVNLNVAFINTAYNCTSDAITLNYLLGTTWLPISPTPSCVWSNYILSYSALLPFRSITVQFILPNIYTIGGLRVGLSGPGNTDSSTATLQTLGFSQTFNQSGRIVGQDADITLQLTKVINNTSPLVNGNDEIFSGIWIGSFMVNYYESFMTVTDYLSASPMMATNLTLAISETSYYILNEQRPITSLPEVIYHDFLFIVMVIGMFVLVFVIIEVVILPCSKFLMRKCKRRSGDKYRADSSRRSISAHDDLENPTSHSNKQEYSEQKHNNTIADSSTPHQRQTFNSDQHTKHSENVGQQLPSAWNREAYL